MCITEDLRYVVCHGHNPLIFFSFITYRILLFIIRFLTWFTGRVLLAEQELFTLKGHPRAPSFLEDFLIFNLFVFCVVLCGPLLSLLSILYWPLVLSVPSFYDFWLHFVDHCCPYCLFSIDWYCLYLSLTTSGYTLVYSNFPLGNG